MRINTSYTEWEIQSGLRRQMAPPKPSRGGFSLFGIGGGYTRPKDLDVSPPSLTLQTDKNVYRPGDPVVITIQIQNPIVNVGFSLLIERLSFEAKGIEKLDTQWFTTQKSSSDSKQLKRGEYVFMDCSVPSLVSNQILSSGITKTYMLRMILPSIIPPSYKGSTVRYLYYVRSMIFGQYLILENGHLNGQSLRSLAELEARSPLQIWVTEKTNGLINEGGTEGIVPASTFLLDVYWKEMDAESEWARANETFEGLEEGYESSKDEISSVSSYNPARGSLQKAFGSSLSLQSSAARSGKDTHYPEHRPSISSSYMALPRLSVAEVYYDSSGDILSPKKSSVIVSPSEQLHSKSLLMDDELRLSIPRMVEPVASEGFIRGRSYNIRLDDQVLLRFSPKKPESTYYFSDMIGGTLTFFHEEGVRRCLELSITLELSETISQRSLHPSRRHSPTITKVYSDHHEVVADLVQTSFLFSIPMDGPMSFSTRHVSVQWMLRFEFFTTPKNVDWTRLEHPLLIDGRDKCEWVLPVNVHAPPLGASSSHSRTEKPQSLQPLWVHA